MFFLRAFVSKIRRLYRQRYIVAQTLYSGTKILGGEGGGAHGHYIFSEFREDGQFLKRKANLL